MNAVICLPGKPTAREVGMQVVCILGYWVDQKINKIN